MVYLDNAATTPVRPEVFEEMKPYFTQYFGNASSIYDIAKTSKKAMDKARKQIADAIGALPEEIFFTGCGSESDNWALKGTADALSKKGKHIITTKIEHHAILHTGAFLENHGFEVTYLNVDKDGIVDIDELKAAIRKDTILISVMFANNEIGTIEPIAEIGKIAHEHGILFHTDAVQAMGHVKINVNEMNIDMLSMSGHKIGAQKGIGVMYKRKGVRISNLIHGGAQEQTQRAGTENIPAIVGLGKAVELSQEEMEETNARITKLREKLKNGILEKIPYSHFNGHPTKRLPGNTNFSFEFVEGESMLLMLNMKGICASSGSACTSGSLDPSHVLMAIGLPHERAHGSLRFTIGRENTEADIDYVLEVLPPIVSRLREMSPLYADFLKKNKQ